MALPTNNGVFIHEGLNCSPVVVPTAQSIPLSPSDSTSVKTALDNKSNLSNIADTYNPTDTYSKDNCVIYEGVLYQCINSSGTTGTWVPADWTAVKAVDVGSGGGGSSSADQISYDNTTSGLSAINVQAAIDEVVEEKADRVPMPAEYDSTVTYYSGDICTHDGNVYFCHYTTATGAWEAYKWRLLTTPQQDYLHSVDPVGVGSFSLNRKAGTTVGKFSFAGGLENNSSGYAAHAEGRNTRASGNSSHAEGNGTYASGSSSHAEGSDTSASGNMTHAEGGNTSATGIMSHTEGYYTKAKYRCQHVFGEYNVEDPSMETNLNNRGNYVEIVGNGTADNNRSNARTLDWSGNEVLAGGLKINNTQNVAAQVSLTQAEYYALVQAGTVDLVNTIYFITDADAIATSATEVSYSNTTSGLAATNVQSALDEMYRSKTASSGGTDLSLVTTGDKYNWDNKCNPILVSTVAISINYGGQRYAATTVNVAKSGYTVLGTVGYQMSSIDNCVFRCNVSGDNLIVGIFTRNGTTTTEVAKGYVNVLYVKQG